MNFEMTIDLPGSPEQAWDFFTRLDNLYTLQPDLVRAEILEGEKDHVGAVARLVYRHGNKERQVLEIIDDMRPPEFFSLTSQDRTGSATNYVENYFEPYNQGTTWRVVCNYSFKNKLLLRIVAPFIRGSLQKRLEEDMVHSRQAYQTYLHLQAEQETNASPDKAVQKDPKKKANKKSKSKKKSSKSKKKKSKK